MNRKARRGRRARPMDLRHEAYQSAIARFLFLGWSAERIARRLGCSAKRVRYQIATPEFTEFFEKYQHERFKDLDHKIASLLPAAVDQLAKLLHHKNWKARNAAISRILDTNAPVLQRMVFRRLEAQRPLNPIGRVQILPPMDDLTDQQRAAARDLLKMFRGTHPRPSLPDKPVHHSWLTGRSRRLAQGWIVES